MRDKKLRDELEDLGIFGCVGMENGYRSLVKELSRQGLISKKYVDEYPLIRTYFPFRVDHKQLVERVVYLEKRVEALLELLNIESEKYAASEGGEVLRKGKREVEI